MLGSDTQVVIDIENTTFGELEDAERILGRPILPSFQSGRFDAATLQALVLVNLRKTDSTISADDVRNLRIAQVSSAPSAAEVATPADPTPPAADPGSAPPPTDVGAPAS